MKRQWRTRANSWSSRIAETLRSALSWMRWRQRARAVYLAQLTAIHVEQQERLRLENQLHLEAMHDLLLSALIPLSKALQRQDQLLLEATAPLEPLLMEGRQVRAMQHEQIEMLGEVLNSLQPTAEQQLLGNGQPAPVK